MIVALTIGTFLAVAALAFVLYPVFFAPAVAERRIATSGSDTERDAAVSALREIEFDRATGKLSDPDYADLKARYTEQAVLAMRREHPPATSDAVSAISEDAVESALREYRERHAACAACGPRPESDAEFCSTCGRYLHDRCATCGAPVVARDARYCINCGTALAA